MEVYVRIMRKDGNNWIEIDNAIVNYDARADRRWLAEQVSKSLEYGLSVMTVPVVEGSV
jgi:5-hydroxyisourate hydrolase-like protein (transthyretin family)